MAGICAAKVTARSSFGAISLEGVGGAVDGRTGNGAVHYSGTPTAITLRSEFGGITADLGSCDAPQEAKLRTSNVSVAVTLPGSASVNLSDHTGNGNIVTSGFAAQTTRASFEKSLKAILNSGRIPMSINAKFGSLTITAE